MEEAVVSLRAIESTDALVLMELNNDDTIAASVVGNPAKVSLDQQMRWMARLGDEKNTKRWMITFDGPAVGTIILSSIDMANLTGNMNIKLLPAFQGKGIAKKALKLACDIAFDEIGLFCLTANVLTSNERSASLFKRIGFSVDGVLRSRVVKNGERRDLITLSYLKSDRGV